MEQLKLAPLISESKLQTRIQEIGKEIEKRFQGEEIVAVGILKGSFMFYADLLRAIDLEVICEFMGTSSYGDSTKSSGQVKMTLDLSKPIEGKNVLIIEDIVDTGLTMNYLMKNLRSRQPKSLTTVSLLSKPEAIKEPCELDYVGFEIGNEFVVGYGLDFQGYYRNLPYIATVQDMN